MIFDTFFEPCPVPVRAGFSRSGHNSPRDRRGCWRSGLAPHESPDRRSVSTARPGRAPFLDPASAPAEPVGTEFEGCREPAGPNIALERRDRSAAHVGCAPPAGDDRIVAERSGIGCIDHVISRNSARAGYYEVTYDAWRAPKRGS